MTAVTAPDPLLLSWLASDAEEDDRALEQEEADRRYYYDVPLPRPAGTRMEPDAIEPPGSPASRGSVPSPAPLTSAARRSAHPGTTARRVAPTALTAPVRLPVAPGARAALEEAPDATALSECNERTR